MASPDRRIEDEAVEADAAGQEVVAAAAVEHIVARRADDEVGGRVADAGQGAALEGEVFHRPLGVMRIREAEVDEGEDAVSAARAAGALVDDIAGIVDEVAVVATEPAHHVGVLLPVERVGR